MIPVAQIPDAPRHHDRRRIGDTPLTHCVAQRLDPRIGVLWLQRVFRIRQAIMPACEPRVLINHGREPFRSLRIGPLPQRAKGAARTDDRQVIDVIRRRDLAELIRHPRAAGHARNQPLGPFEHTVEHALSAAHFPQHVDIDSTLAARDLERALHLLHRALDRIFDEFLVPLAPRQRGVDLRDDLAVWIVAVGVDRRNGADSSGGGPSTGGRVVGRGDPPCRPPPEARPRGLRRRSASAP